MFPHSEPEPMIPIKEVAKSLNVSIPTIWRWLQHGVRGQRLESKLVGGRRFTTKTAVMKFISALNSRTPVPSARDREAQIEAAERELNSRT